MTFFLQNLNIPESKCEENNNLAHLTGVMAIYWAKSLWKMFLTIKKCDTHCHFLLKNVSYSSKSFSHFDGWLSNVHEANYSANTGNSHQIIYIKIYLFGIQSILTDASWFIGLICKTQIIHGCSLKAGSATDVHDK